MTEAPVAATAVASTSNIPRHIRRQELRELNSAVWDGANKVLPESLDSSLKKNTAFIKRCRVNLIEESQKILLNEVATLSLEKYLSEILAALCEGFTKCKSSADLFAGVEVASALHQRFGTEFSPQLLFFFFQGISNPDKANLDALRAEARAREDQSRTDRHKIVLRVLIELWLVNVFRFVSDVSGAGFEVPRWALRKTDSGVSLPPPLTALEEVLNYDLDDFSAASIAIVILKNYGHIIAGISRKSLGGEDQNFRISSSFILPDTQRLFFQVFQSYTLALQAKLKVMSDQARRMERRNDDAYVRTGKILEDRREELEKLLTKFTELESQCTMLSDYLGIPMPEYKTSNESGEGVLISLAGGEEEGGGIWDDDEQKKFYEDLVDLSYLADYDDDEKKKSEEEENHDDDEGGDSDYSEKADEKDQQMINELDALMSAEPIDDEEPFEMVDHDPNYVRSGSDTEHDPTGKEEASASTEEEDNKLDSSETTTAGTRISELLASLSNHESRANVDKMAIEFVALNNKASRNRVLKFMIDVPFTDTHRLPFYARFVATLDPFCKDITEGIIEYHYKFFRYLQEKRKIRALASRRLFNIRFLCELIKFGIVPKHIIFHNLKTMIANLDPVNVENLFIMFEGCGRYLMRKPNTRQLMIKMVQVLEVQKEKKFFFAEVKALIEGALQFINPPPKVVRVKTRPIIEQYIRKLAYQDLSKETSAAVLQQFRKMDWNDEDTFRALRKVFTKIWKVKYSNVEYIAWFVSYFGISYRSFAVYVVDALLENIRRGLEVSSFEFNQKRISEMRFLAELFRYRVIPVEVIYDVLFMLISFAHPNGRPQPGVFCELDPPDEFFRIRLICTFLESPMVLPLLMKGDTKKLDLFVKFLQFYIFTKDSMSMDIEFQVRDTFEALKIKLVSTPQEASHALQQSLASYNGKETENVTTTAHSNNNTKDRSDANSDAEAELAAELEAATQEAEADAIAAVAAVAATDTDAETEEERFIREEQEKIKDLETKRVQAARADSKAMVEIEREFEKLMVDRMDRRVEKKISVFDEPVPSVREGRNSFGGNSSSSSSSDSSTTTTVYKLMKKVGNKPQVVDVSVPSDAKFVVNVAGERNRLQMEKDRIREIVLNYDYPENSEPKLRKIVQPDLISTRYSKRVKPRLSAPTIDDIKL